MKVKTNNNRGHVWVKEDDGSDDIFAFYPEDPHNGPRCAVCGYGYCHHCHEEPQEDCTVNK